MRFVDQCRVKVIGGDGGNGAVAFRREKYIPFGGPSGGDGGHGGEVVLVGDEGMSTLIDFTHVRTLSAKRGQHGSGSDCHGRAGVDREERVPVGTQIHDHATGELIADVTAHGQRVVVAKGGKGGRGNLRFATPTDRAPRRHDKGDPGEMRELDLTLKVMADVGLIGFPNVGKSTFVAAVSAARPKIADYPFTTLAPMLGVVEVGGGARAGGTNFVVADIPGLIPGASEGVGLGIRFLQHVERTRVLLHLVTLDAGEGREPLEDYRALRRELRTFSPELAERPGGGGAVQGRPHRREGGLPGAGEALRRRGDQAAARERGDARGAGGADQRSVPDYEGGRARRRAAAAGGAGRRQGEEEGRRRSRRRPSRRRRRWRSRRSPSRRRPSRRRGPHRRRPR